MSLQTSPSWRKNWINLVHFDQYRRVFISEPFPVVIRDLDTWTNKWFSLVKKTIGIHLVAVTSEWQENSGNAIISVRQINALNKINNSHNLLHNCLNTRTNWYNFPSSPCLREAEFFLRLYWRFDVTTVTGSLPP